VNIPTISSKALHELQKAGVAIDLIDVRTPAEFEEVHCEGARLVPLDCLNPQAVLAEHRHPDEPLYVTCRSGSRARQACARFIAAGFSNVVCVEGGTLAWEQAGLPVMRGRKTLPLDRQVRIATGLLLVLAAALAFLVHLSFLSLVPLVGLGLIYAGVTDRCGMALTLARMPWNQRKEWKPSCCSR
jgi:rhodanese-related sulfurtransferase